MPPGRGENVLWQEFFFGFVADHPRDMFARSVPENLPTMTGYGGRAGVGGGPKFLPCRQNKKVRSIVSLTDYLV